MQENSFIVRVWTNSGATREAVVSASLEIFKSCQDTALSNWLLLTVTARTGLDQMTSRGPLKPPCSVKPLCEEHLLHRICRAGVAGAVVSQSNSAKNLPSNLCFSFAFQTEISHMHDLKEKKKKSYPVFVIT